VAVGTGEIFIGGQNRIKKQQAPQINLLGAIAVAVFRQSGFKAAETAILQRIVELIEIAQATLIVVIQRKARRALIS